MWLTMLLDVDNGPLGQESSREHVDMYRWTSWRTLIINQRNCYSSSFTSVFKLTVSFCGLCGLWTFYSVWKIPVLISLYRSFIEDSQANIKISRQDNSYIGLNDRLVTVVGTLQQQVQATSMILSRLSEDLYYIQSTGPPFQYAGMILSLNLCYSDMLLSFTLCQSQHTRFPLLVALKHH